MAEIKSCSVRVNKEPGSKVTEVFITKTNPAVNFCVYLEEDVDIETGQYDLVFKKVGVEHAAAIENTTASLPQE